MSVRGLFCLRDNKQEDFDRNRVEFSMNYL